MRETERNQRNLRMVECRCDCGQTCSRVLYSLKRSFGCSPRCPLVLAATSERSRTHGLWRHPLYSVWENIIQRCTNPSAPNWGRYGGRGIGVCQEWRQFANFYRDMAPGYRKGLVIDRTNNSLGYSKENCRWTSPKENTRNRTCSVVPGWVSDIAATVGIERSVVYHRVKNGWDLLRACTKPVRRSTPKGEPASVSQAPSASSEVRPAPSTA